ncbi:ABC transporter ATP-binding protein [Companilactobacillus alimentarius]|uniref:Sodium ABC transporter ATP-binding protein n=1 Tax=Companilactobacillus alimentarius DSM 20249 TaxID=1423720 RepID=A0A2K9HJB7_9LACO|nr:ATP-binding cassette domain-containing protein [Companilactobacillus alimentarius]AUI72478.1 sodium ABC transporter ATP-binding protein [Companilactobacillus alimentarius DSM 20249]KRK77753.1 ABC transporter, ATP-binding protein [Companilactobacillus alimentarius DSM 20249]GEO45009.1 ABC transporter ATP-binding protein [Companilactobacillus alimentarius]
MLKIDNISKKFDKLQALDQVSFNVEDGQILGLIGQNGAGKSTTFHSILNFLHYQGTITWNDETINEKSFDEIGYLPEERSLMPKLTIEQQIIYLARLKDKSAKEIRPQIDDWLKKFAVKGDKKDKIKDLSKGNQQKVQLICTLIHNPKLIILDEPFSGLDPVNSDLLKQAIITAKENGAAIIFSSHDMENVEEICDKLVMLRNGKVVLNGTVEEVRQAFGKTRVYVTTDKKIEELAQLPHVVAAKPLENRRFILYLDEEDSGKILFDELTHGKYIEEFSQQPPTLNEIFRRKAGEKDE